MEGGEPWSLRGKEGDHLAGEKWCVYEDEMSSGEADLAWRFGSFANWHVGTWIWMEKGDVLLYRDGCLNISLSEAKRIYTPFFLGSCFVCLLFCSVNSEVYLQHFGD